MELQLETAQWLKGRMEGREIELRKRILKIVINEEMIFLGNFLSSIAGRPNPGLAFAAK